MPLTDSQIARIERSYSERRFRNDTILEKRKRDISREIPTLKKIDDEIAALSLAQAKKGLSGELSDTEKGSYLQKVKELSKKKTFLITKAGFPANFLDPIYDCPDCKDTGYANGKRCHCYRQMASDLLYSRAGLSKTLEEENFENFCLDYYSPNFTDSVTGLTAREAASSALKTAQDFIRNFKDAPNLLLYGQAGVGKTFLSNCIAKEVLDAGDSVIYVNAGEFFDSLADDRFRKERSSSKLEDYLNCDLLILDDLGSELNNAFTASALFSVVNGRQLRRKSTIISTNLGIDQIGERYSERTFSRLLSSYTVRPLLGDDIRIQKRLRG